MKFHKWLNKSVEVFLIFLMSALVIDVLWQVFSRYLLASPSSFTDEIAGFLLMWTGLLGAAYVAGRNEHLAIDILLQKTRESRRKALQVFIHSLILAFSLTVLVAGGSWLVYSRFLLTVNSAALQLPLGYVYLVLPLCGLLIAYYSVYHIVTVLKETTKN